MSPIFKLRGSPQRINEPPWASCLQGAVDARWVVVVVVVAPPGGAFWTNRAEADGQLVLSPTRLPEQLPTSR